jgi:hypothetical protein
VPHSENTKPSWYGKSVRHPEGDTLVIDTLGETSFVDVYRTPDTEKLHVVERWRIVNNGKMMEATFAVDCPDAFLSALVGNTALSDFFDRLMPPRSRSNGPTRS